MQRKKQTDDLISRQTAIDCVKASPINGWVKEDLIQALETTPSSYPETDGFCTDCKEYDQEKHFCPRFDRVIKKTVEEMGIIHCKDCRKHNVSAGYKEDCCPLYEWRGVSYGHEHDFQYCCYAERRTDDER